MFSLIITIVSIALVVLLAIATIYFGGPAVNKSASIAQATESINQGNQVLAAMDLHKVDHGHYPDNIQQLVDRGYLKQIPSLILSSHEEFLKQASASSSNSQWEIPVARLPVAWTSAQGGSNFEIEVCKAVNFKARKYDGILKRMQSTPEPQCYGQNTTDLKIVVSRSSLALEQSVGGDGNKWNPTSVLPPKTDSEWLITPKKGAPEGGGSGSGTNTPPAQAGQLTVSLNTLDFPNTEVGSSSSLSFSVSNTGTASLALSPITYFANGFSANSSCPTALPAGQSCSVDVSFSPAQRGLRAGEVSVSAGASTSLVSLNARGVQATSSLQALTSSNFGSVELGQHSDLSFIYSNTGDAPSRNTFVSNVSAPLSLLSNECGTSASPVQLNPGQNCSITVRYSPVNSSNLSSSLTVNSSADNSPVSLNLSGTVVQALGSLTANTSTGFGSVTVGQFADRAFTFTNTGTAVATGVHVQAVTAPLSIVANNCGTSASPVSLNQGQSCEVTLRYSPSVAGASSGLSLTVISSATNSPLILNLTGSGVAAVVRSAVWSEQNTANVEPSSSYRTYSSTAVGQTQTKNFFLRSTGNASISTGLTLSGDTSHFKITRVAADGYGICYSGGSINSSGTVASPCTASQSNFSHIRFEISYRPQAQGNHSVTLTPSTDNATILPSAITISGSSNTSPVGVYDITSSLDPVDNSYTFPDQAVGTVSAIFATRTYSGPTTAPLLSLGGYLTGDTQHFSIRRITANSIGTCSNGGGTAFTSTNPTRTSVNPCLAYSGYPDIRVEIIYAPKSAGSHQVTFVPTTANGSALPAPTIYKGSTP